MSSSALRRSWTAGAEHFVQAGTPLGSNRVNAAPWLLSRCRLTLDAQSQAKIALKASSEDEILELEAIAKSLNVCARSIQDA